jgi:exosome complex component CSL4
MTDKKLVLPGEEVGSSVEYLPGFGVYSDDDRLYSSGIGELELDTKNHSAKVKSSTRIPRMQSRGTVTIGVVADVSDNKAMVDLAPIESKSFLFVPQGATAVLNVAKVKRGYVKSLKDEIKVGDIIRVKIIEVSKHTVHLAIDDKDLGVIKSRCSRCKERLERDGYKLVCGSCGNVERRKIASDYGTGRVI